MVLDRVPRPDPTGFALAALAILAVQASGGILVASDSTITTKTIPPRVYFEKGDNADDKRWFKSFTLSTNKTSFDAIVKPRAGGNTYIPDGVDPTSRDDASRSIELTGSEETNSKIEVFRWCIYDGTTNTATLDHQDSNPSTNFTLPSNGQYRIDLHVDLAQGASKSNAGIDFWVQLEVT